MDISATLPALLKRKGWTQDRLADEAEIRRTDVNALARGRIKAGPARLRRIADALEVSVLELAPAEQADAVGLALLDRLEELEESAVRASDLPALLLPVIAAFRSLANGRTEEALRVLKDWEEGS